MAGRMNTGALVKVSIGGITEVDESVDTADIITAFEADTYTEVGELEDAGTMGDGYADASIDTVNRGRTQHFKGNKDAEEQTFVVGMKGGDEGQQAMRTAFEDTTSSNYNVKFELNDGPAGGTNTTFYRFGMVTGWSVQGVTANNVVRVQITFRANSDRYEVPAAEPQQ